MKAAVSFDFSDADRRLVARFLGQDALATHVQCIAWARAQLRGSLNVMAEGKPRPPSPFPQNRVICEGDRS
jgi:hypothetical protein